jgi:hypothetical protein
MGRIHGDIEGSIPILNRIVNNKFSTGFDETPEVTSQSQERKSATGKQPVIGA